MPNQDVVVYGADWCIDCRRVKRFLNEHHIPYHWIDIERDRNGEQFVLRVNHGKRIIPTMVFKDGLMLVEPSNEILARKLGL